MSVREKPWLGGDGESAAMHARTVLLPSSVVQGALRMSGT